MCQTVAVQGGGIDGLLAEIDKHWHWLQQSGRLLEKRKNAAKFEVLELSRVLLQKHLDKVPADVLARNLNRKDINLLQRLDEVYAEILKIFGEV